MQYADYVYTIIKLKTLELDSIYEDYIVKLVGESGLTELRKAGYLESCGNVNGRALYTLLNRNTNKELN